MAAGPLDTGGAGDIAAVIAARSQVLLPPVAYDEPIFTDVVCPPAAWTLLAGRDFQRAAVVVFRLDVAAEFRVRSGNNAVAVPFLMLASETQLVLKYVDYLTIVTGELYGFSAAGETVTVSAVRRL